MARWIVFFCVLGLAALPVETASAGPIGGLNSRMVRYIGGTVPSMPEGITGWLKTESDSILVFEAVNEDSLRLTIPYAAIDELEYGQEVGRRVGMAMALRSHLPLFSKKRKHYLTIGYTDRSGQQQAIVLELGKDVVRPTLAILEAKTGRQVLPQDDEARKTIGKK
jgi:hypothetical protein